MLINPVPDTCCKTEVYNTYEIFRRNCEIIDYYKDFDIYLCRMKTGDNFKFRNGNIGHIEGEIVSQWRRVFGYPIPVNVDCSIMDTVAINRIALYIMKNRCVHVRRTTDPERWRRGAH